ncbi:MAG: hypothetical protein K8M05_00270 [Deltaproteobacteria bacterium]|nr:hypothetical protein [Kofleriaceae bacterium]
MARRSRFSWWMLVVVVVAGGLVMRGGACGACTRARPAPDERLAQHLRNLCEVAEDGAIEPRTGVRKLMRYYGDHGPDMLHAFGATLVTIERVADDAAHDARARVARDRIQRPLVECAETWERFAEAVENDREASETLERGLTRFGRTLEILFGDAGRRLRGLDALSPYRFALDPAPRP